MFTNFDMPVEPGYLGTVIDEKKLSISERVDKDWLNTRILSPILTDFSTRCNNTVIFPD